MTFAARGLAVEMMGFGFHRCTILGCTVKVKGSWGKNMYRTKIVQKMSGRKDGEDGPPPIVG